MSSHIPRAIQTLRLSASDRQQLFDHIQQASTLTKFQTDRRSARIDLDHRNVVMRVLDDHGQQVDFAVQTRNISNCGLAVIHGRYVHEHSRCRIFLPQVNDDQVYGIEGHIARSRYLYGIYHEVVILFNHPIDLTRFVKLNPFQMRQNLRDRGDDRAGHMILAMMGAQRQPIKYAITPKSLDEGSLSFHHGICFAPATPCVVGLPRKDGGQLNAVGQVRSSQKIGAGSVVVTVDFNQPIDCNNIATSPEELSESLQTTRKALIVAQKQEDAIDLAQRIRTLGMAQFEWAKPHTATAAVLDQSFELLIVDGDHQPLFEQVALLKSLRKTGYCGPLVMCSSSQSLESQCQSMAWGSSAFLVKPIQTAQLRSVLARLIQFDQTQAQTQAKMPYRSAG